MRNNYEPLSHLYVYSIDLDHMEARHPIRVKSQYMLDDPYKKQNLLMVEEGTSHHIDIEGFVSQSITL